MKKFIKQCLFAVMATALSLGAICLQDAPVQNEELYVAKAEETFGQGWTTHANAQLSLKDIQEGGVGTVSYYTVPAEDGLTDPVNNSVFIPCSGYDLADDRVSIKYDADFPITGQNITVYTSLSADVGADGSDLPAEYKLIGWFENWNVTTGQCEDGYNYITINHAEYSGTRTVNGVVLQFNYAGDTQIKKTMRLLGVDLHSSASTPLFATDENDIFSVSNATTEDCGLVTTLSGWRVTTTESGSVSYAVNGWDPTQFDCLLVDCISFDGGSVTPYLDGVAGAPVALSSARTQIEIPAKVNSLQTLKLEFSGTGTSFIYSITGSSAPKAVSFSTSNNDYFTEMTTLDDATYQVRVSRNAKAGWPEVTMLVENWREEYDIVCIDINVLSGKALTGVMLGGEYLLSHWDTDNVLDVGQHSFTFFAPLEIAPNWNGREMTLYFNPASVLGSVSPEAVFEFGIHFEKSSSLPAAEIIVEKEVYEFAYDGEKKPLTATVLPVGTSYTTSYISGGQTSKTAPSAPGEYTVRFEVAGSLEMRRTIKEVLLIIVGVQLEPPQEGDWSFDFEKGTLVLASGLEASYMESFDTILAADAPLQGNKTVYIRRAATSGMLPSNAVTVTTPPKANAGTLVLVERTRTKISVSASGEGVEYRLITGTSVGEWKTSGTFIGLKADTEYTIEARVQPTQTTFGSEVLSLTVKTKPKEDTPVDSNSGEENNDENNGSSTPDSSTDTPTQSGDGEEKKGCNSSVLYAATPLLFLAIAVFAFVKGRKNFSKQK